MVSDNRLQEELWDFRSRCLDRRPSPNCRRTNASPTRAQLIFSLMAIYSMSAHPGNQANGMIDYIDIIFVETANDIYSYSVYCQNTIFLIAEMKSDLFNGFTGICSLPKFVICFLA